MPRGQQLVNGSPVKLAGGLEICNVVRVLPTSQVPVVPLWYGRYECSKVVQALRPTSISRLVSPFASYPELPTRQVMRGSLSSTPLLINPLVFPTEPFRRPVITGSEPRRSLTQTRPTPIPGQRRPHPEVIEPTSGSATPPTLCHGTACHVRVS
jgi:hypothetical protein